MTVGMKHRWVIAGAVLAVLAACLLTLRVLPGSHRSPAAGLPQPGASAAAPPGSPVGICNKPILDSPWSYDGAVGTYSTSGTPAGLPTFGAPGTTFPDANRLVVVPSGNNTTAASSGTYQLNNAVIYFEPGVHTIQSVMFAGNHSAYVGGYTASAGKAIIDGVNGGTTTGTGGSQFSDEKPSSGNTVDNTWEYLTVENYSSSVNSAVMGTLSGGTGYGADGDVWKYDTIGPNEYAYNPSGAPLLSTTSAPGQGGGYAIYMGSYSTAEYDCLTRDAQGGFAGDALISPVLANDEISWNGLGIYPDSSGGGSTGGSPNSCGCSGGGKFFYSVNADVVNNYVHDNYNVGIWLDFDNSGALISHNYITSNWAQGITVEASYNSVISDNTLVGNGWASDGPWPAGVRGGTCYGGVSCTNGDGPVTGRGGGNPYGAIYLPNSGGDSALTTISVPSAIAVPDCSSSCTVASRYSGEFAVTGNKLIDNFGGVNVYTDTNRFPDNIDDDSSCSNSLGPMNEANNSTYYAQTKVLQTAADTAISGSSVTSAGGTKTLCSNYGDPAGPQGSWQQTVTAPSVGMAVFDERTGKFLGNVAGVTSAHSFTLNQSAGTAYTSGDALLLSVYGGCGPADYFAGGLGVASGRPSADYWDHCIWGSRNVTVQDNVFSLDASKVAGCTAANMCGYQQLVAFNAGVPALVQYWFPYTSYISKASGGLGNVFSDNVYTWAGGGPGAWQFMGGDMGTHVTRSAWTSADGQDAGSRFGPLPAATGIGVSRPAPGRSYGRSTLACTATIRIGTGWSPREGPTFLLPMWPWPRKRTREWVELGQGAH
jgi:parallel beta-helix repeat protein